MDYQPSTLHNLHPLTISVQLSRRLALEEIKRLWKQIGNVEDNVVVMMGA